MESLLAEEEFFTNAESALPMPTEKGVQFSYDFCVRPKRHRPILRARRQLSQGVGEKQGFLANSRLLGHSKST
jgi:hypothetical protein